MTKQEAWFYAASWGSYIHSGDPGACMYGFNESFHVQSEEHRRHCLDWIERECRPDVIARPQDYDLDELAQMDAFVVALEAAKVSP